jgi:hypothetical protein
LNESISPGPGGAGERLDEIRATLARKPYAPYDLIDPYEEDVSYLLSRVEELGRENEKLRDTMQQIQADSQYIWWE